MTPCNNLNQTFIKDLNISLLLFFNNQVSFQLFTSRDHSQECIPFNRFYFLKSAVNDEHYLSPLQVSRLTGCVRIYLDFYYYAHALFIQQEPVFRLESASQLICMQLGWLGLHAVGRVTRETRHPTRDNTASQHTDTVHYILCVIFFCYISL